MSIFCVPTGSIKGLPAGTQRVCILGPTPVVSQHEGCASSTESQSGRVRRRQAGCAAAAESAATAASEVNAPMQTAVGDRIEPSMEKAGHS